MFRRTPLLAVAALLLTACSDQSPTTPRPAPAPDLASSSGVWGRQLTGTTESGALWAIFVPTNWNGDVVYYAHGIVDAALPVALPIGDGFPDFRDALGGLGYAVAYSSFSQNGWAVKDGAETTHDLRATFARNVGRPRRSYLTGTSLGGLVAQKLADTYKSQYTGTLAMCAPLGGATTEVDYIANVRVLFDALYPGVVPGDVLHVPAGIDVNTQVLGPAQAAITANPTGLGIIARIKQTPLAGANGTEVATSLLYALAYDVRGIDDLLGRTNGQSMFDNSTTVYDAIFPGLLPAPVLDAVNAAAGRFTATRLALDYLDRYYVPDGNLSVPEVTLHTTRDPLVPFFHEDAFAQRVAERGASGNLVQRSVSQFGHCAFTTTDMVNAFQSLASWVDTGIKPTS